MEIAEFLVLAAISIIVFGAMGAALAWRRAQLREQRETLADGEHVREAHEYDERHHRG